MKLIFIPESSTKNNSEVVTKRIQIIFLVGVDSVCFLYTAFIVKDSVESFL